MRSSPQRKAERILGYGRSNSGKTSMWVSLAQWIAEDDGWDSKVYVGDTDNTWDAIHDDQMDEIVRATHVTDYLSALAWAKATAKVVRSEDWVVYDLADRAWPWAQEHYNCERGGDEFTTMGDVLLKNQRFMERETGGKSMAGPHGSNWGVIYGYYNDLMNTVCNMPCHVLFVAAAREIREDTKPALVAQYKNLGWYPAGPGNEHELAHNAHTIIFCSEDVIKGWIYTTVRERGAIGKPTRTYLKGEQVQDFVMTYLMGVAGWRP